jgi:transcriptional regulator with XRE-family HTH domain
MAKTQPYSNPLIQAKITQVGENIHLARLRRNIPLSLVAERAGISYPTVIAIEKGSPRVSMGAYAAVLHALGGLDGDLTLLAKDDKLGRLLLDQGIEQRKRARRNAK